MRSIHDYMDLVNDWLTSAIDQVCIVIRSRSINHWPGSHSHEYTEIKSITALSNNKEFFKLFNSIFNKIGYNCFIIFQDYLNIKILKYNENFEILWNFWKFWNFINFEIYKINKNFMKLLKYWIFLENLELLYVILKFFEIL